MVISSVAISRVKGTSVNLKNKYAGYGIDFIVNDDSVQHMIDFVTNQIPGTVRDSTGCLLGSLVPLKPSSQYM